MPAKGKAQVGRQAWADNLESSLRQHHVLCLPCSFFPFMSKTKLAAHFKMAFKLSDAFPQFYKLKELVKMKVEAPSVLFLPTIKKTHTQSMGSGSISQRSDKLILKYTLIL